VGSSLVSEARPPSRLTEAEDGLEGVALFCARDYDLVVSDWNMPGATGLALLQAIRLHPTRGQTPVILLTGLGTEAREQLALEAGASGCLTKPFSNETLLAHALALVNALHEDELAGALA
jgi:two-component system chemotaxis response regulator CheY